MKRSRSPVRRTVIRGLAAPGRLILHRPLVSGLLSGAMLVLPALSSGIPVAAQSDTTAPVLLSASLDAPATQDISDPQGGVIFYKADITDDLSGMSGMTHLSYASPSGKQSQGSNFMSDGEYPHWGGSVSFPQYSETGVWTPSFTLTDASGNTRTVSNSELLARGIDMRVTLTGTADTTAPVMPSASRTSPATMDLSQTGQNISVSASISDNLAGMSAATQIAYTSPSGKQQRNSGLGYDGTNWQFVTDMLPLAEKGVWTPTVTLVDAVGNQRVLTNTQLLVSGIDLRVTVTSNGDSSAPVITNMSLGLASPVIDNVPFGGAIITSRMHITDSGSGIANGLVTYTAPNGQQYGSSQLENLGNGDYQSNISLPVYSQAGTWQPTVTVRDNAGNVSTYTPTNLLNLGFTANLTVAKNVTVQANPGQTVTSDEENDGATLLDSVEAAVTAPDGGPVSIVTVASNAITDSTNGYRFFDRQISITAPTASVENPLTLAFRIDASKVLIGQSAATLQVTRNGTVIPACTDATTATPDPCIFSRTTLSDGDIQVKVHSTTASVWGSGFPDQAQSLGFKQFGSPIWKGVYVGLQEAGATVPVSFDLADYQGLDILAAGSPTSQAVNCFTGATLGSSTPTISKNKRPLRYTNGHYVYDWKTANTWDGTCRKFSLKLTDGTTHSFSLFFKPDRY